MCVVKVSYIRFLDLLSEITLSDKVLVGQNFCHEKKIVLRNNKSVKKLTNWWCKPFMKLISLFKSSERLNMISSTMDIEFAWYSCELRFSFLHRPFMDSEKHRKAVEWVKHGYWTISEIYKKGKGLFFVTNQKVSHFNLTSATRSIITLTHYVTVLPSYRNQSTELHGKSIDWFLYEGDTDT